MASRTHKDLQDLASKPNSLCQGPSESFLLPQTRHQVLTLIACLLPLPLGKPQSKDWAPSFPKPGHLLMLCRLSRATHKAVTWEGPLSKRSARSRRLLTLRSGDAEPRGRQHLDFPWWDSPRGHTTIPSHIPEGTSSELCIATWREAGSDESNPRFWGELNKRIPIPAATGVLSPESLSVLLAGTERLVGNMTTPTTLTQAPPKGPASRGVVPEHLSPACLPT